MGTTLKTKTFDCVEMKDQIQAKRRAEYEARRDEFASYEEFIQARAADSEWVNQMRERFRRRG
jgi:hypothetical protein